ncbi:MAG TPA: hypothetical protein VMU39_12695 [Solirubrobacteraceae bacterium]|nr:hypothetical protein [Solirubrobacteraceae bacterium]
MATVLIELPGGEGIVRRDDGEIVLTHDVTLDWGQSLEPHDTYQPVRIGLSDERLLFGGLLPPGAVSVEAVEATGLRKSAAVGGGRGALPCVRGGPVRGVLPDRGLARRSRP